MTLSQPLNSTASFSLISFVSICYSPSLFVPSVFCLCPQTPLLLFTFLKTPYTPLILGYRLVYTGPIYTYQMWYYCNTCNLTYENGKGCCYCCILECHRFLFTLQL